ncbi:hypothetical protein [Ureibacillus thermophilus]|uniref:Uncharacterized protein n=1 Tax=Ureibacillus thermophilus TaxID=367743 RepID=A0A4P6UT57_9BACL|nr:hypothetical protein [Ureibacillus thermophilus]QBK26353.1 hypothetical protein DKZ56_11035 [Ureibacillus thermophilus]
MTKIQVTNDLMNLFQLQEELDRILFNYVDTSQKWDIAYEELGQLLNELNTYFRNYIQSNNRQLPENEMYWSLFMDNVSRIMYFKIFAYINLQKELSEEQKEKIKHALYDAASCLPDVQGRNYQFLQEIGQTYSHLYDDHSQFEKTYLAKNNRLFDCIKYFHEFCLQKISN